MCNNTMDHEEMALSLQQLQSLANCLSDNITQWKRLNDKKGFDALDAPFNMVTEHATKLTEGLENLQLTLRNTNVRSDISMTVTEF